MTGSDSQIVKSSPTQRLPINFYIPLLTRHQHSQWVLMLIKCFTTILCVGSFTSVLLQNHFLILDFCISLGSPIKKKKKKCFLKVDLPTTVQYNRNAFICLKSPLLSKYWSRLLIRDRPYGLCSERPSCIYLYCVYIGYLCEKSANFWTSL